jgi:hypothetical protein
VRSCNRRSASLRARLRLEHLESRELLSGYTPTNLEQEFLERLNDARANPAAYGASIGVDLSYVSPAQPLAFDTRLIQSARDHSQDMNDNNYFGHTGSDGSNPGQRETAAGFPWQSWAESIAAGYSTPEAALAGLITDSGYSNPDAAHRGHLLGIGPPSGNSAFPAQQEVGVGIVSGSGSYHYYYTVDTGYTSDTRPFLTGVVYNDLNHNGLYDAGEGLGGVTITVSGGGGSTTTWSSGGYSLQLSSGTYTVTASGGSLSGTITQTVTVGSSNYRLNFVGNANHPPVLSPIADQTVAPGASQNVSLSATDPDGDPVTFTAQANSLAYLLKSKVGLTTYNSSYDNWGGQNEKWILSSGGTWYFILPSGTLKLWDGSSTASGTAVANLDPSYWTNPTLLTGATSVTAPATVTVSGSTLTVRVNSGASGNFGVAVTASDGKGGTDLKFFKVTVSGTANTPPVLATIPNQTISHTAGSFAYTLSASDPDGDPLTFSATVASQAYTLKQTDGLFSDGNLWYNWGGKNEKWMQGAGGTWYYILPTGQLYLWDGSGTASGTLVATLETAYYTDPSLLYNAGVGGTAGVSGTRLTVTPSAGFVGKLTVTVTVSDGFSTDTKSFILTVT